MKGLKNKNLSKEDIDEVMRERGLYIGAFLMMPCHGLITDFINGHGNILLYEGVSLKEMIIPNIPPVEFKYTHD